VQLGHERPPRLRVLRRGRLVPRARRVRAQGSRAAGWSAGARASAGPAGAAQQRAPPHARNAAACCCAGVQHDGGCQPHLC
jgi:hypothetical protein